MTAKTETEVDTKQNVQLTVDESILDQSSAPDDADSTQYPSGFRFWVLIVNLSAVIVLGALDMSIVATAGKLPYLLDLLHTRKLTEPTQVPRITDHFHTVADVGWYAVAFRLTQCASQFLYGKAYKLFSIKLVFLIANGLSFLGSLLCAAAITSTMFIIGRAVAGLGTAAMEAGAYNILVQSAPLRIRPTYLGIWGAIEGISTIAGPLIGGAITQTIGWRWCFYISLPIGGATLSSTLLLFSEKPKPPDIAELAFGERVWQLDILSTLILVPSLLCLFLAFSWAGTRYAWNSGKVVSLMIVSVALAAAFVYNQFRRGEGAALPVRIMRHRTVVGSFIFVIFHNSAGNTLEYYLPVYYQAVRGYKPAKSGVLMLPILLVATLGAIGSGIGTSVCGYYTPFMIFISITMSVAAGLVTTLQVHTGLVKIIAYTGFFGLGYGFFGLGYGVGSTGPGTAIQTVLEESDVPLGVATLMFGSAFGPAVIIAIAQVIFANQLSGNLEGLLPGPIGIDTVGLTQLVALAPAETKEGVLLGINNSAARTWYLVIGLACATLLGSLMVEWRSVKKDDPNQKTDGSKREEREKAKVAGDEM